MSFKVPLIHSTQKKWQHDVDIPNSEGFVWQIRHKFSSIFCSTLTWIIGHFLWALRNIETASLVLILFLMSSVRIWPRVFPCLNNAIACSSGSALISGKSWPSGHGLTWLTISVSTLASFVSPVVAVASCAIMESSFDFSMIDALFPFDVPVP